jgi:replication initiation protein RepC
MKALPDAPATTKASASEVYSEETGGHQSQSSDTVIIDYAKGGVASWRDFLAAAVTVRPMLGINPSAWEEAQIVMGETRFEILLACLPQRGALIQSAGGYLRELTRKARAGELSLGPILMARINARTRERKIA